ncbi:hypothetical protein LTR82_010991 [Friedmanniomyces endolithicus]|uniref:F-box domain-containing protein n=1 Tax=Friedmanniomyces endolithicus TaxID=329885 RepID=A0AAN6FGV1_9PEZI|nr:hypothetical protein LTR82_010991 [Friedmanniomyces endolithicus]
MRRGIIDIWYDRYSAKLLRKFIEARTGKCSPSLEKLCFVQQLVNLDANWTFRFLDLPPEIRNLIYGHLLRLRDSRWRADRIVCSTAVLSTCKQIHAEATGILYVENIFDIVVRSMTNPAGQTPVNRTTVSFTKLAIDQVQLCDAPKSDIDDIWPTVIRKAESIRLVVRLDVADCSAALVIPDFKQANKVLHSFASSRNGAANLKRLQLVIKGETESMPDSLLQSIFYPLTQLAKITIADFAVQGIPDTVTAELQRLLRSGDTRRHADLRRTLMDQNTRATRIVDRARDVGCKDDVLERLARHVQRAVKRCETEGVFLDAAYYAKLSRSLRLTRACLDGEAMRTIIAGFRERKDRMVVGKG